MRESQMMSKRAVRNYYKQQQQDIDTIREAKELSDFDKNVPFEARIIDALKQTTHEKDHNKCMISGIESLDSC